MAMTWGVGTKNGHWRVQTAFPRRRVGTRRNLCCFSTYLSRSHTPARGNEKMLE